MKLRHVLLPVAVVVSVAQFANQPAAQSQDVRAAYDRAESLTRRTQGLVVDEIQALNFVPDSARLWYRKTVKGGHRVRARGCRRQNEGAGLRPCAAGHVAQRRGERDVRGRGAAAHGTQVRQRRAGDRVLAPCRRWPRPRRGWSAGRRSWWTRARLAVLAHGLHLHEAAFRAQAGSVRTRSRLEGRAARGGREGPAGRRINSCGSHPTASGRR